MVKIILLLLGLIAASSALQLRSEEHIQRREALLANVEHFAEQFSIQYDNYTRYGVRSKELESMFKMMQLPPIVGRAEIEEFPPEAAIVSCLFCRTTVAAILQRFRAGASKENLMDFAFDACMQVTTYGAVVCRGLVNLNADSLFFIIGERPSLTANQICSVVLQGECGDPDPVFDFSVSVSTGPPITAHKSGSIPRSSNEIKILHFSDPHYDPAYLVGGYANCPEPTCCRRDRGIAVDPADRAGRWGDYRDCDSPWEVVEDAIRSARRDHPDASIVYITGDFVDHGVWETTHAGNIAIMDRFYNLVRQVFAGVAVYPVLGNHEAQPTNVFAPTHITDPALSVHWLYEHAASAWASWLPASALTTVRAGGYYTVLNRPGFRIIAMNNNDCYVYNWWILYSRNEVAAQLQWLHNTLLAAEAANEYVHIVHHIPSGGGSCLRWWSREYRRIIDRFHRIISGQFMGHSHRDEFNVFYARNTDFAVNYAWNGGATTTYSNVNPNYVVYHVDNQIFQVNEADSWYYSITEANLNPNTPPVWRKLFSMRADFGLPDLSPASLNNWVTNTLARNRATLRRYFEYKISMGDPLMTAPCDDECLRNHLCAIVINEYNELRKCDQLRQLPLA
ncbi:sphingomyelin phosphodiesterase-like [Chironomus tepperi]|uniref:sphingomyelin phosphodiesterase-like n=1 Tax=Chironomus tepperi TaxID=113505 RepID=UPI00391EF6FD